MSIFGSILSKIFRLAILPPLRPRPLLPGRPPLPLKAHRRRPRPLSPQWSMSKQY